MDTILELYFPEDITQDELQEPLTVLQHEIKGVQLLKKVIKYQDQFSEKYLDAWLKNENHKFDQKAADYQKTNGQGKTSSA